MDRDADDPYLWVSVDEAASPPRIVVRGELDAASAGELKAAVDAGFEDRGEVLLDLEAVTFLDSSGLRSLIEVQRRSATDGFEFQIVAASEPVRRVLDLTGTSSLLAP